MRSRAGLAFFLAASLASALVADRIFERVPHIEDEHAYLFQAQVFALGRLWAPTPEEPAFFSVPFLVDYEGRRFGKYPPGHALALAPGMLAGHPWLVNPVAGAAALAGIVWLGAGLFGRGPALLAGLLGLTSPFFLLQSGSLLAHPTTLLGFVVFLVAWRRLETAGGQGAALVAGLALAFVFLSRPFTALGLMVPWVVLALSRLRGATWRRSVIVLAGASALGPLGLAAYQAALTGSPWQSTYTLYWPYDRPGFGPGIGVLGAHTPAQGLANIAENLGALQEWLLGWPAPLGLVPFVLGLAPVVRVLVRRGDRTLADAERWTVLLAASAGSLVVVHGAYWTSGLMYGPRYMFEALPAWLLLSGKGLWWLGEVGDRWLGASAGRRAGITGVLVVTAALAVFDALVTLPRTFGQHYAWYGASGRHLAAVRAAGLTRALVLVRERPGAWTTYGSVFAANDPLLEGPLLFARDLGPANSWLLERYAGRPVYVLDPEGRLWPLADAP